MIGSNSNSELDIQRRYYGETANKYDSLHVDVRQSLFCFMLDVGIPRFS
jgi:hypothetical protein